jgi:hypothetical protein
VERTVVFGEEASIAEHLGWASSGILINTLR